MFHALVFFDHPQTHSFFGRLDIFSFQSVHQWKMETFFLLFSSSPFSCLYITGWRKHWKSSRILYRMNLAKWKRGLIQQGSKVLAPHIKGRCNVHPEANEESAKRIRYRWDSHVRCKKGFISTTYTLKIRENKIRAKVCASCRVITLDWPVLQVLQIVNAFCTWPRVFFSITSWLLYTHKGYLGCPNIPKTTFMVFSKPSKMSWCFIIYGQSRNTENKWVSWCYDSWEFDTEILCRLACYKMWENLSTRMNVLIASYLICCSEVWGILIDPVVLLQKGAVRDHQLQWLQRS